MNIPVSRFLRRPGRAPWPATRLRAVGWSLRTWSQRRITWRRRRRSVESGTGLIQRTTAARITWCVDGAAMLSRDSTTAATIYGPVGSSTRAADGGV